MNLSLIFVLFLVTACNSDKFKVHTANCNNASFFYQSSSNLNGEWDQAPNASVNIWKMSADGLVKTAITKNSLAGLSSDSPSVSKSGKYYAFHSLTAIAGGWDGVASLSNNVWVADTAKNNFRAITSNTIAGLDSTAPHISPDGKWITFLSKMALSGIANGATTNSYNLWVASFDGSTMRPITKNTNLGYNCESPKFSPDSKKIVFACQTALDGSWNGTATLSPNIWIAKISDDSITPLTLNTVGGLYSWTPQFTPDNLKIAFASNINLSAVPDAAGLTFNLWVMGLDGTNKVALTQNTIAGSDSLNPYYSPDGTKLSFQSFMGLDGVWDSGNVAHFNLWLMDSDGSNLKPVTKNITTTTVAVHGVFALDGKSLVYRSLENLSGVFDDPLNLSLNVWRYTLADESREALTQNINVGLDSQVYPNTSWVSECTR